MNKNSSKDHPDDRARIAVGEDGDASRWAEKFGVTRETLIDAVAAVGTTARTVAAYLGKQL